MTLSTQWERIQPKQSQNDSAVLHSLCCTGAYEVPKLLLFKRRNSDPLCVTIINKCNSFIACPITPGINDLDRHPAPRIPPMTAIPDMTPHGQQPAPAVTSGELRPRKKCSCWGSPRARCNQRSCLSVDTLLRHKPYSRSSYFTYIYSWWYHWKISVTQM